MILPTVTVFRQRPKDTYVIYVYINVDFVVTNFSKRCLTCPASSLRKTLMIPQGGARTCYKWSKPYKLGNTLSDPFLRPFIGVYNSMYNDRRGPPCMRDGGV